MTPSKNEWSQLLSLLIRRLYVVALLLYLVSLGSRSIIEYLVYRPEVAQFSRPAAELLRFMVQELQMLATPWIATVCVVIALILQSSLKIVSRRNWDHDEEVDSSG